ncbi:IS66 family transposase [Faecalibaculum rodentium]|uniref:IS66 family transposase n=1 Tax=Faecalibaculum rodentium TaxID=1702221 RepID=UPI0023F12C6C|nr:IS66 family transposase [Faecalibaculum rodentium]
MDFLSSFDLENYTRKSMKESLESLDHDDLVDAALFFADNLFQKDQINKKAAMDRFASKSELLFISLFNEAEEIAATSSPEDMDESALLETVSKERSASPKKRRSMKEKAKALPEKIINVYPEAGKDPVCPVCGTAMKELKPTVHRTIKYVPQRLYVEVEVDHNYVCPKDCEDEDGKPVMISASRREAPLLENTMASTSLVSHIIAQKTVMGLPLYRQEQDWLRRGFNLSRSVMASWMIRSSQIYGEALVDRMIQDFRKCDVVHMDETVLKCLEVSREQKRTNCYMIVGVSGEHECRKMVIYQFKKTREQKFVRELLGEGFEKALMSDGFEGYDNYTAAVHLSCMAHARRHLYDAVKIRADYQTLNKLPDEAEVKLSYLRENPALEILLEPLGNITRLYKVEKKAGSKKMSPEKVYELRQKESKPLFDQVIAGMERITRSFDNGSKAAKGANYFLKRKDSLARYLEDGNYPIDNNLAERMVKPFVIGRKGFLFADTEAGAEATAVWYSLSQSAIMNGLVPEKYIEYVLTRLKNEGIREEVLDELLPYSRALPEYLYKK